jgi:hypothetical protein
MSRLSGEQMTLNGVLVKTSSKFEVDEDLTTVEGGNPRDPDASVIPFFYDSTQSID